MSDLSDEEIESRKALAGKFGFVLGCIAAVFAFGIELFIAPKPLSGLTVLTAGLMAAINVTGAPMVEQRVAMVGFGSAGSGIAALLLRDVDSPRTFISFGPWESMSAVRNWRALPGYQEQVARLRDMIDDFEPRTLEVVTRH